MTPRVPWAACTLPPQDGAGGNLTPLWDTGPQMVMFCPKTVGPSDLSMQTQENRAEISGWQEEGGKTQERGVHVVLGSSSCGPWPDSSTSPPAPCSSKIPGSGLWMQRRHREPVAKAGAAGPAVRRCRGAAGGVGVQAESSLGTGLPVVLKSYPFPCFPAALPGAKQWPLLRPYSAPGSTRRHLQVRKELGHCCSPRA